MTNQEFEKEYIYFTYSFPENIQFNKTRNGTFVKIDLDFDPNLFYRLYNFLFFIQKLSYSQYTKLVSDIDLRQNSD